MPPQYTNNPQKWAPAAADGVSLAPSGSSWVSGAYAEIVASMAAASVLTGIVLRTTQNATLQFEVDIAVGAAASEVVIATFKGLHQGAAFSTDVCGQHFPLAIPVDAIPSGSRVAARIRVNSTSTTAWTVSIGYYEKPITGNLDVSAQPVLVAPSGSNLVSLAAPNVIWASGSWSQVIASTSAAIVIDGVIMRWGSNNSDCELDIGVGGSGAESVVTTIRGRTTNNVGGFGYTPLFNPFDGIGSGVRVSLRVRGSANFVPAGSYGFTYREKPL